MSSAQSSGMAGEPFQSPLAWLICTSTLLTLAVTLLPRLKVAASPVPSTEIHEAELSLELAGASAAMPRSPPVIARPNPLAPTAMFRLERATVISLRPSSRACPSR